MNSEARAWLDRANEDLLAARKLEPELILSGLAAFHAQQAIEKAFKAVIIVQKGRLTRIHDLKRLGSEVEGFSFSDADEQTLVDLSTLYIESRYPGDFGMLPDGRPGKNDVERFIAFAEQIHQRAVELVG